MSAPDSPSSLDRHLGYWLRAVSNAVSRGFAARVEAEGVSVAEWVFLRLLHDVDSLTPSVLAERIGMTKGAITKLGDRLVARGLVERRDNPGDRRGQMLALTPEGRDLVPVLARHADANDAAFFDALPEPDRQALDRILRTLATRNGLHAPPTD